MTPRTTSTTKKKKKKKKTAYSKKGTSGGHNDTVSGTYDDGESHKENCTMAHDSVVTTTQR